jgi:hypothetical protein
MKKLILKYISNFHPNKFRFRKLNRRKDKETVLKLLNEFYTKI